MELSVGEVDGDLVEVAVGNSIGDPDDPLLGYTVELLVGEDELAVISIQEDFI